MCIRCDSTARPLLPCRLSDNEHLGLPLSLEPETAKWFPRSNSAQDVRDALVAACRRRGAAFRFGAGLRRLRRLQSGGWACETEAGEVLAQRGVCGDWARIINSNLLP